MTLSLKHSKVSNIPDGPDEDLIRPSDWNDEHDITMAAGNLLGRTTANDGPVEELDPSSIQTLLGLVIGSDVQAWAANLDAWALLDPDNLYTLAEAFLPRGAWDNGTTYAQNDLVSHEGFAFVSNADGNLANEPVVAGSPPSEPASDTNWTHIGTSGTSGSSDVTGSSTTSIAIEMGSKMWTVVEEDRGWAVGARLRVTSDANPTTHYVEGVVTAYSGSDLTITVDLAVGSGSRADWTFNLAGEPGEDGEDGAPGADGDPGEQSFDIACSDETTDLTTGAAKVTFRMPYAFVVSEVRASVSDPPTGSALQVDINEGGVSILSTEITIDDGDSTSLDAGTPPVISDANLADDAEITIDIDQIGSSNAGAGLKVSIIGNPA